MPRNPRWNPAVGDRFRIGSFKGVTEREVVEVSTDGTRVDFKAKGQLHSTPIKRWREWAIDAQVL